jgi:tetratricopeptide (TPR) repeat protein
MIGTMVRRRFYQLSLSAAAILGATIAAFGAPGSPAAKSVNPVPTSRPAVAPPIPAEEIIAKFLEHVKTSDVFDAQARDFVVKSRESSHADTSGDFINNSLAILSEPFKIGLDLMAAEKPDKAADIFDALSKDENPFLAVASASLAATALIELEQMDHALEILDRVREAHNPVDRFTLHHGDFLFMYGYCLVHALKYEEALAALTEMLARYPAAPDRLRVTATQIVTELSRRSPGGMGDVRDLLNYARRRIGLGETHEPITTRQKEAVELLTAMIEDAENQEKSKGKGGGKKSGGAPQGGNRPGGATRSTAPGGESQVGELRKVRASPGEAWGKMPPREREEILQTLQRRFPSQYRELLEQYYQQLAKDAPAK